ncbi:MAG: hypothetical protein EA412_00090 [Chitinophagaceae bacterium]|nr:MAG: hypothetical protein EA412_00090 [Chitinophagaceae bacterium]
MENNELQLIWRTVNSDIKQKSRDELDLLLSSKARQVFTEFLILNITAIPVCIGLMVWLLISTAHRIDDRLYVANNILLGSIVLFALFYVIREWYRFKRSKMDKPVKEWLETEINLLSKWLIGKYRRINFYIIPIIYILSVLSIHVYYSELYFTEVFRSDKFINEDMWGFIIFTPILFAILYYSLIKLRKHQINKLQFLKDLHDRLCNYC